MESSKAHCVSFCILRAFILYVVGVSLCFISLVDTSSSTSSSTEFSKSPTHSAVYRFMKGTNRKTNRPRNQKGPNMPTNLPTATPEEPMTSQRAPSAKSIINSTSPHIINHEAGPEHQKSKTKYRKQPRNHKKSKLRQRPKTNYPNPSQKGARQTTEENSGNKTRKEVAPTPKRKSSDPRAGKNATNSKSKKGKPNLHPTEKENRNPKSDPKTGQGKSDPKHKEKTPPKHDRPGYNLKDKPGPNPDKKTPHPIPKKSHPRQPSPKPSTQPTEIVARFCPRDIVSTNKGIFIWPKTKAGSIATIACPHGENAKATRLCKSHKRKNTWKPPRIERCSNLKKISQKIFRILEKAVNSSNVVAVGEQIRNLSHPGNSLIADDVANTASVLEKIVKIKEKAGEVADSFINTVDNILDVPLKTLKKSQRETNSSARIVESLTGLLEEINVNKTGSFKKFLKNFAVHVSAVNPRSFSGASFAEKITKRTSQSQNANKQRPSEDTESNPSDITSIQFPKTLFQNTTIGNVSQTATLVFTLYKETKLFSSGSENSSKRLNSYVIAGGIKNLSISNLKSPVVLTYKGLKSGDKRNAECVFWSFKQNSWSTEGCSFAGIGNDGTVICHCTHLTNFAMLMDVNSGGKTGHEDVLSIVSYIGCGLSLIGLLLTIFTILLFKDLRTNNPTQILLNLCIALTVTLVVFLAAAERSRTSSMFTCRIAAIALHYFVLATFMWMAMEAFNMYLAFVVVLPSYIPKLLLKCCVVAWGLPAVFVGITVVVAREFYGDATYCRLAGFPFMVSFLLPVMIILLGNTVAFFLIFRSLLSSGSKVAVDTKTKAFQRVRHASAVLVVLGLTWIFGVFAIKDTRIVFQYLFCIFNTLQGLFIFVFYCCLPQGTRDKYRRFIGSHVRSYRLRSYSTKDTYTGDQRSRAESNRVQKKDGVLHVDAV